MGSFGLAIEMPLVARYGFEPAALTNEQSGLGTLKPAAELHARTGDEPGGTGGTDFAARP